MLSYLIISTQRFVFIVDEVGKERIASKCLRKLLHEQGQDDLTIKNLELDKSLHDEITFNNFVNECLSNTENKWNVLLPPLSDLLCYQRPAVIFEFLQKLRKCDQVKRTFLWASTQHLMHPKAHYLVAACEYMSDLILHLNTLTELSIVIRSPGGGIIYRQYIYKILKGIIHIEPRDIKKTSEYTPALVISTPEQKRTFKIELDEDELVARNALKLPYEKTSESNEGNIIYTPDAQDDFDDEDPDEDLCI